MPTSAPARPAQSFGKLAALVVSLEAYMSLALVLFFTFSAPLFAPDPDPFGAANVITLGLLSPALPEPFGGALAITLWACCWLFAISGVRHGAGAAAVAAGLSLCWLMQHALLVLVVFILGLLKEVVQ
jgi:hypothetical protein